MTPGQIFDNFREVTLVSSIVLPHVRLRYQKIFHEVKKVHYEISSDTTKSAENLDLPDLWFG